jgi:queuine/archaeosine tRNA-ribosyltransferase
VTFYERLMADARAAILAGEYAEWKSRRLVESGGTGDPES